MNFTALSGSHPEYFISACCDEKCQNKTLFARQMPFDVKYSPFFCGDVVFKFYGDHSRGEGALLIDGFPDFGDLFDRSKVFLFSLGTLAYGVLPMNFAL